MVATETVAVACLGPKLGKVVDDDLNHLAVATASGEMVDDPISPTPVSCLGFEGKMIKRLCGQGFLFATLTPGWERTILWFESKDMPIQNVKEMIRALQYNEVYSFKDVIDFTPFVHTRKSACSVKLVVITRSRTRWFFFFSQGSSSRL